MKIYHYDRETGEFLMEGFAAKSPLDDAWLIPAFATIESPPATTSGQAAYFISGHWEVKEDHRGKTIYSILDASGLTVGFIGQIPVEYTELLPPVKFPKWENGAWISDPVLLAEEQAAIEAAEAAALAEAEKQAAKAQAIIDNLPSRAQVHTAVNNISNLADAKAFLLKLTDVVYWLAKDKAE